MDGIRIAFLLVLAWVAGVAAARPPEFNVDLFCGWDGCYRPMEWTPVEIGVSADLTEPFQGIFSVSAPQDGLNTLNILHEFALTPELQLSLPLVTKFAFGIGRCELTIRDERGRVRWEQTVDMWDFSAQNRMLVPVRASDLLLGLVGQPRFGLLKLPSETVCLSHRGRGKVHLGAKVPRMVPWDWTGFASLDLLILYDPDWALLRTEQLGAIAEWVSNGGTLLLVLGRHPLSSDNPLADVVPFAPGQPRRVEIPPHVLSQWGLDDRASEKVTAWPLTANPRAAVIEKAIASDSACFYGIGHAGFGRVAVLGFDPAELGDTQMQHAAQFWIAHTGACLAGRPNATEAGPDFAVDRWQPVAGRSRMIVSAAQVPEEDDRAHDDRYRIGIAQSAGNKVLEYLYELPQMRPLSIWWVVLTLSALAVLLGPLDYFVLKRLDKLPLTWLTSTGWIVIFTVGAYYGVQTLRGGKMQLRAVSVVDGIVDGNSIWGTYYTGLFAPRSDDYRPDGLGSDQWWSAIAPSREQVYAHQSAAGMQQVYCRQADGANLPVSVPINIWTIQSLLGEMRLETMPFEANVMRRGEGVTVEIANATDVPIRGGFVLLQDAYGLLGPVAARATRTFELLTRPFDPWVDGEQYRARHGQQAEPWQLWQGLQVPRYPGSTDQQLQDVFLAQGCLNRTVALHGYLDRAAALVTVEYADAPAPFTVANRSYDVTHTQYARLLVLPSGPSEDATHD
jgi:hypothetical protein